MVDLLTELPADDPYPAYAVVRARAPVVWNPPGVWLALGYGEVRTVLRDAATFATATATAPGGDGPAGGLDRVDPAVGLFVEPAHNRRLRRLLTEALSPDLAAALVEGVTADVRALLDRLAGRLADGGTVDLVAELADLVPVATLARLVGAPVADGPFLLRWAERTDALVDLGGMGGDPARLVPDRGRTADALQAAVALHTYADRFVAGREQSGPTAGGDMLDALLAARAADPTLSRPELVATVMTVLTAGHSATVRLLGTGLLTLLRAPDQLARLAGGSVSAASATEELLRYDPPVQLQRRLVVRDTDLGGCRLSAGQVVLAVLGAANRDPEVFAEPDRLDLGRDPVGHLSFGAGTHQCAGAALGRLQLTAVLEAVARRLPEVELSQAPAWRAEVGVRALAGLPVRAAPVPAIAPGPAVAPGPAAAPQATVAPGRPPASAASAPQPPATVPSGGQRPPR